MTMKAMSRILKPVCFALLFVILWLSVQAIFQPAFEGSVNSYVRATNFYAENPAPEVVTIGTSHVYYGINPLVLFEEYGIANYDFTSPSRMGEAGALYVSEAIKTHNPSVIVLDAWRIDTLLNDETTSRKWFDPIPFSFQKVKAVWSMLRNNQELDLGIEYDSFLSYMLPLLRYHGRWSEPDATMFDKDPVRANYHGSIHYHGYGPHYRAVEGNNEHYNDAVSFNEDILKIAKENFAEIVSICEENETELLLIGIPSPAWRQDYHDLYATWADEYGVPFLDYNEMIDEIGIDYTTDTYDGTNHLNDSGAVKVSHHLGQYLQENYGLPDHRGDPAYAKWDEDWEVYQQDKASYFLSIETDWASYVEKLQNPNYTIYMVVRGSIGGHKYPELTGLLTGLGLDPNVRDANRTGYVAVIDSGEVINERMENKPISYRIDANGHHIELSSESSNYGNLASIKIDGVEHFINRRGLGIVVYDNLLEDVVDSVTFDFLDGGTAYRK